MQYSGYGKREMGFFDTILHIWKSGCSFTCCHFPPWEKSWGKKFCLGAELCCLGGVMQVKSNCFFYLLQCNKIVFFFLPWYVVTSLLKNLDFHKGSYIWGWLSKTAFFRGSWIMAQMDRSPFTGYFKFTVGTEVCAHTWVGKTPGSLGIWHWITQLPQRHFCPWMDTKLLLFRGKYDERCLIQPLGSTEWEYCHLASSWESLPIV